MSTDARRAFLDAAAQVTALLGRRQLAAMWDDASALPEMTNGALAGHVLRGMATVEIYLDGDPAPTDAEVISADTYFFRAGLTPDIHSDLNVSVRQRAVEMAAGGPATVATEAMAVRDRLAARLLEEPLDRTLPVLGGMVLTLDGYLVTRIVELLAHADDLSVSLGITELPPPPGAAAIAFNALVGIARLRHGDLAVVRAFTRRERDSADALRIF